MSRLRETDLEMTPATCSVSRVPQDWHLGQNNGLALRNMLAVEQSAASSGRHLSRSTDDRRSSVGQVRFEVAPILTGTCWTNKLALSMYKL